MTSLTIDVTETTLILDKVFQVYKPKRGYFCINKNKVKEKEPLFCCWTCTILLLMVGKFEGEKSTKLITLSILRLPAKIQKYQIGPAGRVHMKNNYSKRKVSRPNGFFACFCDKNRLL